ncbi:MAG TPA: hypothetical protein VM760_01740 [Sphingomicrobium sp.]|jgi:hypothetical protein|nr:hypothetical protein [Sphingomicrobium sp.]
MADDRILVLIFDSEEKAREAVDIYYKKYRVAVGPADIVEVYDGKGPSKVWGSHDDTQWHMVIVYKDEPVVIPKST